MQTEMESPLVAAQRSAIVQLRGRYERGQLPFDTFRDGLDAITQARSPEECAAILRDLPHSPLATLAALDPPALAPAQRAQRSDAGDPGHGAAPHHRFHERDEEDAERLEPRP